MKMGKIFSLSKQHIKKVNEERILISALEFFVDYKFNTGSWMQSEYLKRIEQIDHNEYAKLYERMGGRARFKPTIDKETINE